MRFARGKFRLSLPRIDSQQSALRWLAGGVVAITLALYLAPSGVERKAENNDVVLEAIPVDLAPSRIAIHASGVARPASEIPLVAEVSGRVLAVDEQFVSGAIVTPQTVLATVDPEAYQLALAQRENEVNAAALHVAETRARAQVARQSASKRSTDYARMVPHLAEAESRLEAARAARRSAEQELARTRIRAPFRGRLREVRVKAGQYVRAGDVLGYLYTPDTMEVRLPVRDEWLSLLDLPLDGSAPAAAVPVQLSSPFAGVIRHWQGEIVRREGGLDRNQMVTLIARITTADDQLPLEPGVWLDAVITGRELSGVATLPESVVGHDGGVWLVDPQQRLIRRKVSVLYRDDHQVYVSSGLSEGDQVVLAGNLRLMEGAEVRVRQPWLSARVGEDEAAVP